MLISLPILCQRQGFWQGRMYLTAVPKLVLKSVSFALRGLVGDSVVGKELST